MTVYETEARRVRDLARTEHYHRGPATKYEDIARHVPHLPAEFVALHCELAGFPVWTSVPDELFARADEEAGRASHPYPLPERERVLLAELAGERS